MYFNATIFVGLAFEVNENGTFPPHVVYKIRQNATISQTTTMTQDTMWSPGSDQRGLIYLYNGFVWLQVGSFSQVSYGLPELPIGCNALHVLPSGHN